MSVSYMTHPLIKHKISVLRRVSTGEFRKMVEEIAALMGYIEKQAVEFRHTEGSALAEPFAK